jgi:hypothetical protein
MCSLHSELPPLDIRKLLSDHPATVLTDLQREAGGAVYAERSFDNRITSASR